MTITFRDADVPADQSIFSPRLRASSIGVLVIITLIAFEEMAVNAALPTAARELGGIGYYGWAFTGFLAATIVGLVVAGQLCDERGPRLPLIAGVGFFAAGLVVSGTATTMVQLVLGRVVQGAGGGLLITAVYVVIGERYPSHLQPKAFAATSSAWVVPSLLGPLISGFLAQSVSWRWVFLGLLPFIAGGAALLLPTIRSLAHRRTDAPRRQSVVGRAIAAAAGIAALEQAGQRPSWVSIPLALAGVAALIWGLSRLLPPGTVQVRRGVAAPIALRGLLAGAFFGVESIVPLGMSVEHGYLATAAALPLACSGVSWAVGSWWQGRTPPEGAGEAGKSDIPRRAALARAGFVLVGVAAVLVALTLRQSSPGWLIYPSWALAGLGAGLTMSTVSVLMLRHTNDADRGRDSAALQLSDATCNALATGLAGVLIAAAARGAIGYSTAFTVVGLVMALVASAGVVAAARLRG